MEKFLSQAFAIAFCLNSGVFVASRGDDNNPVDNPPINGETAYVVATTTGGAGYLVVTNSLDEGIVSIQGDGTEVIGGAYQVYKGLDYVFALVYNKGGVGAGTSYYLEADGKVKEKYTYTCDRIMSYGTWGDKMVTISTGDSRIADEDQNVAQALLFNYLDAADGNQEEDTLPAENYLSNGEEVSWAGLAEANNKVYTSVIPMGTSEYGAKRWPEAVTDQELVAKTDGGSSSGVYAAGIIPSTRYPDSAYVAIYSDTNFNETPAIVKTDKIGYACGRMRSRYYQTIWVADNDDVYVFSPGYGCTAVSPSDLRKVAGQKPSGTIRIRTGATDFDSDYYMNFEEIGIKHPIFRY